MSLVSLACVLLREEGYCFYLISFWEAKGIPDSFKHLSKIYQIISARSVKVSARDIAELFSSQFVTEILPIFIYVKIKKFYKLGAKS